MFVFLYIFPMIVYHNLLERTLNYYCEQFIAKFDIKTGVVVYKLVKPLSLIIVAELHN